MDAVERRHSVVLLREPDEVQNQQKWHLETAKRRTSVKPSAATVSNKFSHLV